MTKNPSGEQPFHHDRPMFRLLRRLQERSRSDIPATITQRAAGSFTLHDEPEPEEATDRVLVLVYPQNPFHGEPQVRRMASHDIQPGLVNSRVRVQDSRGPAAGPDEEGNYLYWPGTIEFDQVSAFYYTTFTLRMYERYAHRAIPWAFPAPRITVDPHVGDMANAFYNEHERLLGFHSFRLADGTEQSTAQSADIVSHECGHAVLDGIRDLYNESFGLGPRAFHESFADMSAMLVALHDDSLIQQLLDWTGGDLRMSNFVSEVAEHLTALLQKGGDYIQEHTIYLRNAFNRFEYVPFDELYYTLPGDDGTQLSRQEHSYSRLFTGAFYDILVGVYEHLKQTMPQYVALYRAREMVGHLLVSAVEMGPVGEFDFGDMARAFLTADALRCDGCYRDVMRAVFAERGLLASAAADEHLARLGELPALELPQSINSALAAALFLEQEVLPALKLGASEELTPLATYRSAKGLAYMSFFSSQRITLEGPQYGQYDGSAVDAFGGLTLTFDENNRLRSAFYRPVKAEDVRQIRIQTAEFITHGLIAEELQPEGLFVRPGPEGLWLPGRASADDSEAMLVRFPAILDRIPQPVTSLLDYLRAWQRP